MSACEENPTWTLTSNFLQKSGRPLWHYPLKTLHFSADKINSWVAVTKTTLNAVQIWL